jgi:bacterial/archaeal transporter family-2 protein
MSNNTYFYLILAIIAGMMMPTQGAVNTKLATYVESPISAAFISFAIGTIALFIYLIATGVPLSSLANIKDAPPIAWIGGLLGAFFVSAIAASVPRLGVAMTFSLAIAGQMLVTLIIDHFGFLDVPVKQISFVRILGVSLITIGVILIRKF